MESHRNPSQSLEGPLEVVLPQEDHPWRRTRPTTPPDLLDHDAVGARQLEPAGEVQGVHPAQDQREDHDSQVGLDATQVQPRRDNHQHRVDEAGGELGSHPAATSLGDTVARGGPGGSPRTRAAGRSHL